MCLQLEIRFRLTDCESYLDNGNHPNVKATLLSFSLIEFLGFGTIKSSNGIPINFQTIKNPQKTAHKRQNLKNFNCNKTLSSKRIFPTEINRATNKLQFHRAGESFALILRPQIKFPRIVPSAVL